MKKVVIVLVLLILAGSMCFAQQVAEPIDPSLSFLHALAAQTHLVLRSANSRIALEEMYQRTLELYDSSKIGKDIDAFVWELFGKENALAMIGFQRERLKLLSDSKKTQVLQGLDLMPATRNVLIRILGSGYLVRDALENLIREGFLNGASAVDYRSLLDNNPLEVLRGALDLVPDEMGKLQVIQTRLFKSIKDYVDKNRVQGIDFLSETATTSFVGMQLQADSKIKLDDLLRNQVVYAKYPQYWLELASAQFDEGNYQKCLEAIGRYEALGGSGTVLGKDIPYGKVLARAVVSAGYGYGSSADYEAKVLEYLGTMLQNTAEDDWEQRYVGAVVYLSLAVQGHRQYDFFLDRASTLLQEIITQLSKEQERLIVSYSSPVALSVDEKALLGASKESAGYVDNVNKSVKALTELRKTELPPFNLPLLVMIDLLRELRYYRGIVPEIEYNLDGIIRKSIHIPQLRKDMFNEAYSTVGIELKVPFLSPNHILTIPVKFLTTDSTFKLMVLGGAISFSPLADVKITGVDRKSDNFDTYLAEVSFKVPKEAMGSLKQISSGVVIQITTAGVPCQVYLSSEKVNQFSVVRVE